MDSFHSSFLLDPFPSFVTFLDLLKSISRKPIEFIGYRIHIPYYPDVSTTPG